MTVSFNSQYLTPMWGGFKKAANTYLHFTLGTQNDIFSSELSKAVRGTKDEAGKYVGGNGFKGFGSSLKNAWNTSLEPVKDQSFLHSTCGSITSTGAEIKDIFKEGSEATGFLSKSKAVLGVFGKKMPLICNLIYVATESPNIWRAFTSPQGGIGTGSKELLKTIVKLAGFSAGAAIGQALIPIPFVGAMVGGIVGGWLADKAVGKSFTEKQEAQAQAQPNPQQQLQPKQEIVQAQTRPMQARQPQARYAQIPAYGQNPYSQNPYASNPFAQGPQGFNPQYSQMDFRDKDLMAMSAGY